MLTKRMIGVQDYNVFEDGQHIGRIRFARERSPGVWLWHVQVHIPGPPFGRATSLDDAKQSFKAAWLACATASDGDAVKHLSPVQVLDGRGDARARRLRIFAIAHSRFNFIPVGTQRRCAM